MARAEFSRKTKRAAFQRAGGRCEARGTWYGLEPGHRCNGSLRFGVEFDHVDLDANSHDNSLENCAAVCRSCHRYKTSHRDVPVAAKTLRQRDKNIGIKKPRSAPMPGSKASGWKKPMRGPAVRRPCSTT